MDARSDPPLSWAMRQYSAAFTDYLRAGGELGERDGSEDATRARTRMQEQIVKARIPRTHARSLFA